MIRISPAVRISLALALLTTSILLVGDLLGLVPNRTQTILDARKKFCESLALQLSHAAQSQNRQAIADTLRSVAERNDDILSAALRKADGTIFAGAQDHDIYWQGAPLDHSTPTHAQVPIFQGEDRWGTVEVRFTPIDRSGLIGFFTNPLTHLIAFVTLSGFAGYLVLMRRTLRALDPTSVVPERVRNALDSLAEGVVILDDDERIVLANAAFAEKLGLPINTLLGRKASGLPWVTSQSDEQAAPPFPWLEAMRSGQPRTGVALALPTAASGVRTFMVNGSPILDAKGNARGALATFDDVTELEEKNDKLRTMLDELQKSQEELEFLATRDPLTGCLNRRSFFEKFEIDFERAVREKTELSCLMADIDHFKSINDRYGHAAGDQVIQKFAQALQAALREYDMICRYGGEEFCVVFVGLDVEQAARVAERVRATIESKAGLGIRLTAGARITGSFGISSLKFRATNTADLIDQADKALYAAKEGGRNQVMRWGADGHIRGLPRIATLARAAQAASEASAQTAQAQQDQQASNSPDESSSEATTIPTLQARIRQLEKNSRWYRHALDILSSMGNLYGVATKRRDRQHVYDITRRYLKRLIDFEVTVFLTIAEGRDEIELVDCEPREKRDEMQAEINKLIKSGELKWALGQNHPVEASATDPEKRLLLHVMASKTQVRGMFVGLLGLRDKGYLVATYNIISIIMHNSANALENTELYSIISHQNKRLERMVAQRTRQLAHQHVHDGLTGLPNRLLLKNRLQAAMARAERDDASVALILLDLDMFKRVNDTLGHAAGDHLLREAAERLVRVVRSSDAVTRIDRPDPDATISRLGGDEFAIVIPDLQSTEFLTGILQRIVESLSRPFRIDDHEIHVTTSVGISLFPADGDSFETLLKNADAAMYHAKGQRGNNYQFYSDEMNVAALKQLHLENQLRHAVDRGEFLVNYQPKVNILSGEITGMEALVRWSHPELGMVSPADFIPVAEYTGLINPIGDWVLRTACQQAKVWQSAGLPEVRIAVNLSAAQFRQENLRERIFQVLEETALNPNYLELEITEGTVMDDVESAIATLHELAAIGVHVSIDDFGTGYSSLNYLKRFPIGTLKIDRSFVRDISTDKDDAAIVSAIVAMAHSMELRVVAEGVETADQLAFLRELQCDDLQGYLFSPPVAEQEATELLRSDKRLTLPEPSASTRSVG